MARRFTPDLYARALLRMRDDAPARRLPEEELCVVGAALLTLSTEAAHLTAHVVLPNTEGVLCRPSELLFDDMKAWDQVVLGSEELKGRTLVHEMISHRVAESFGVPSRRMMVAADGIADWDIGESYGQSESITARIKAIIGDYVDDVGIINELIQNADDAGATRFSLMLDKSAYGTKTLLGTSMEPHQGPAMLVYNNATFSEADFQALASLGQGSKLESTSKTGKFGLGFNSVYHFTDVPSFVSGGSLVVLDPHRTSLRGTKEGAPGLKILVPNPICEKFADQFAPYRQGHYGCTLQERFPGTLFRFPLRTDAVAARSKIRHQSYTVDAAETLLLRFCESARDLLLFLRHVKSVEVLVREGPPDAPVVRCLFDMELTIPPAAQPARAAVHRFISGDGESTRSRDALRQRLADTPDADLPTSVAAVVVKSTRHVAFEKGAGDPEAPVQTTEEWLVSHVVGGGEVKRLAMAAPSSRRWIPLAGVALLVARDGAPAAVRGRAFAFLPLPQATGLRFHLNAAFELSANRRNIWFDDFQAGGEASQWNAALLQDACAPAALTLLEAQKQRLYLDALRADTATADHSPYYEFFPGALQTGPAWVLFAEAFYARLRRHAVLYSPVGGGGAGGGGALLPGRWVTPEEAAFLPASHDGVPPALLAVVERALLDVDVPVVAVAPHVFEMLAAVHPPQVVSPDYVRGVFKTRPPASAARPEDVMLLLRYCVTDLGRGGAGGYDALHGLPFLPLQSKRFVKFTDGAAEEDLVFYNVEKGLEAEKGKKQDGDAALADVLVDRSLLEPVGVFHKQAFYLLSEATNLKKLSARYLARLLPLLLPNARHLQRVSASNPHAPSAERVAALWKVIGEDPVEGDLRAWPLLPTAQGYICVDLADTAVQDTAPSVFVTGGDDPSGFLAALGVEVIPAAFHHPRIALRKAAPEGILAAFAAVHTEAAAPDHLASRVAPDAKLAFAQFLAQHDRAAEVAAAAAARGGRGAPPQPTGLGAGWARAFARGLPLWRVCGAAKDAFAAIDGTKFLAPATTPRDVLCEKFYAPASDAERRLLVKLGVAELHEEALYAQHLVADLATAPRFAAAAGENAAQAAALTRLRDVVVKNLKTTPAGTAVGDPALQDALRVHAWVPASGDGVLRRPQELFDPQLKASGISLPDAMFPRAGFATGEMRGLLLGLGLQTALTGASIAAVAAALPNATRPEEEALKLLHYVDTQLGPRGTASAEEKRALRDAVAGAACIPVYRDAPPALRDLPWPEADTVLPPHGLMHPGEVRPASDAPLCSFSCGIAVDSVPPAVVDIIAADPVPHHVLVRQLEVLSEQAGKGEEGAPAPALRSNGAAELYTELSLRLRGDDPRAVVELLKERGVDALPVVHLGGDVFAAPGKVAFATSDFDASPLLHDMPDTFLGRWVDGPWRPLGAALKIRHYFGPHDYATALAGLAVAKAGAPLSDAELATVANIARCVAASDAPKILSHLPDGGGVLRPLRALVYDDMAWDKVDAGAAVVHSSIPAGVAKALGVQSRRQHLQVKSQMKGGLSCPTTEQLQALLGTSAITYLLQDLLEVAFVVEAAKVSFVLDRETHGSQAIMAGSEGYQGPALLMHVDAPLGVEAASALFTPTPPYTSGAKLVACFTVCDCVQVVADDHLLLYAPLGTPARYKLADVRANFPSQLKAFRGVEGSGTTVRLPLRTEASVLGHPCSAEDVDRLLESLGAMVPATLPFLPKLMQVSLTEYRAPPGEVGEEGDDATADAGPPPPPPAYTPALRLRAVVRSAFQSHDDPRQKAWAEDWGRQGWLGLSKTVPVSTYALHVDVSEAAAGGGEATLTTYLWGVCLVLGEGESAKLASQLHATPIGGCAALLKKNGAVPAREELRAQGLYLRPVPQLGDPPTQLPVHIFAAQLHAFRSSPFYGLPKERVERWNDAVEANAWKAYAVLLAELCGAEGSGAKRGGGGALAAHLKPDLSACYAYFPQADGMAPEYDAGVEKVYRRLVKQKVFLLRKDYKQCSHGKFSLMPLDPAVHAVLEAHARDLHVFHVPQHVAKMFCKVHPEANKLTAQDVRKLCHKENAAAARVAAALRTPAQCVQLLALAAKDLNPKMPSDAAYLDGVTLLPLQGVGGAPMILPFGSSTPSNPVFIGDRDAVALLPKHAASFVHQSALDCDVLQPLLTSRGYQDRLGLRRPEPHVVLEQMAATPIPPHWQHQACISAEERQRVVDKAAAAAPPVRGEETAEEGVEVAARPSEFEEWLRVFWVRTPPSALAQFGAWPLLPLEDGTLQPCRLICEALCFPPESADVVKRYRKRQARRAARRGGDAASDATDSEALSSDDDADDSTLSSVSDAAPDDAAGAAAPAEAPVPSLDLQQGEAAPGPSLVPSLVRGLQGLGRGVISGMMGLVADTLASSRGDDGNPNGAYDPIELKAWVEGCGLPVLAPDFSGGTRFQPRGTPAQVVAQKLAASTVLRWDDGPTAAAPEARRQLLEYFAHHTEDFERPRDAAALKQLPIFPTLAARADPASVHAAYTTLGEHAACHAAKPGNPFFKPGPNWVVAERAGLLKALGVTVHNPADVWVGELLPRLHELDYESRYEQLTYVRDHIDDFDEDQSQCLIEYMKSHPLFECCSGKLVTPREFLHPHLELIKEVFGDERSLFPEGGYSEPQWLAFLEQLGMKAEVDAEVFLACAAKIHAHAAKPVDAGVAAKAAMVMDMLKKDWDTLLDTAADKDAFMRQVGQLSLIPMRDPAKRAAGEHVVRLFKFKEVCLEKDAALVVCAKPALPEKWLMRGEYFAALGVQSPPALADVKLSMRSYTEAFLADYPLPTAPTDDFCTALAFLARHQPPPVNAPLTLVPQTGRTGDHVAFGKVACIPITDSVLSFPSRAFVQLDQHRPFPPYVHQVPGKYAECKAGLKLLGVKEAPEPEDYQAIIRHAYAQQAAAAPGAPAALAPTELNSMLKLIELLATREIPVSHVPTDASRLAPLQEVVYNDAPWLAAKLKADTVALAHPRISKALAGRLKVTPLSTAIVESLVGDPLCVESAEAARLTARLQSVEFRDCVAGLCEAAAIDAPDLVTLTRTLAAFEVRFVEELKTRVFLPDTANPRRVRDITGDSGDCVYFVDEERKVLLVAAAGASAAAITPYAAVARGAATMLRLPHPPPFLSEVLQAEPAEMRRRLQLLQIADVRDKDARSARGVLGEKVVAEDTARLVPARQHAVGECVAVEDRAGVKRYGEVMAVHRNEADMWDYEVRVAPNIKRVVPCTSIYCLASCGVEGAPSVGVPFEATRGPDAAAAGTASGGEEVEKETMGLMLAQLMEKLDIPVDPSHADLLTKLEASQRELLRSRTAVDEKTRSLDRVERRNRELEEQLVCKICFVDPVDVVVTCGHAVCGGCVEQIDKCPFCRTPITSRTKLCIA
eukprot:TRINITY_DN757_c3_g1_i2.p1 TRINITY_DN757_c3_g1~~TRINITY_DN757_c3_g1_i2.p1  ORF type:complete len:3788 (+),score=1393.80 TRINITY_DN757_c3_g1_i2:1139-11365(+)